MEGDTCSVMLQEMLEGAVTALEKAVIISVICYAVSILPVKLSKRSGNPHGA